MPKRINALYKFVIKIPIVFRRKDMKFKKILSSFLAFAVAFGAVSFAPFGNNGSFLNSAIVAEAKTGNSATKMPDDAITFSSTYSDELQIISLVNKNGICYYNNKVIYFYSVANNTYRKVYDYNNKGTNKNNVMCTYADAQNGKFYIVWLDSSVKNDYHYYIDEFDAASEKIVSTKDASSFVGSNILSYPKSIGVDSQNMFTIMTKRSML